MRGFITDVKALGLVIQPSKSGFVATSTAAIRASRSAADYCSIPSQAHMRNLGHEVFSGRPLRGVEHARLNGLLKRRPEPQALRRGAPSKVGTLWRTGLLPAGAHGAGVSGLTDITLMSLRTLAGSLVGAKRSGALTSWLATQRDRCFDPAYEATIPLLIRHASVIWDDLFPSAHCSMRGVRSARA